MFPAKFAYAAPTSLQEAVGLLEDPEAKILAGGHSLLPLMKLRLAQPKLLVDIGRIPGLSYVRTEDGHLAIGAMTTYREIQLSDAVHSQAPVLAEAAHEVGDPMVRAKGTLAGICAVITLNGGTIDSARIGVTGVGPKAYRPTAVERALVGKPVEEEAIKAAVQTVADGIDVQGDIHASPEYRAHLARVLTRRAVLQAAARAKG